MHIIKCPQCGARVSLFGGRSFAQWRQGKRQCPGCGVWLKLSNPILIGGLNGLLLGGFITSSRYWGFSNDWLAFAVVIAVCWPLSLILLKILGHWEVTQEYSEDPPTARMWSRVLAIGLLVVWAGLALPSIIVAFLARKLVHTSGALGPAAAIDAFDRFEVYLKFSYTVGFSISAAALLLCVVAASIRNKHRSAHRPVVSNK
jgi:hypothetical protein